jgi:2-haloacid dehalogenase
MGRQLRRYLIAVDAFGLPREEILVVAFAGRDVTGPGGSGYPTFWVNRLDLPVEELVVAPDGAGRDLADLVRFVSASH